MKLVLQHTILYIWLSVTQAKLGSIRKGTSEESSVMVKTADTSSSGCHGAACGRSLKGSKKYYYYYGSKGSKSKSAGAAGYYYSKSKGAKSANYVSVRKIPFTTF